MNNESWYDIEFFSSMHQIITALLNLFLSISLKILDSWYVKYLFIFDIRRFFELMLRDQLGNLPSGLQVRKLSLRSFSVSPISTSSLGLREFHEVNCLSMSQDVKKFFFILR